jgi:hypothetical protein
MFVVCMLALQMSLMAAQARAEDWTDPSVGAGSGQVGQWIVAAAKKVFYSLPDIDIPWWVRR